MRVLKGTLTFILGMAIGIILFVLAIGGAVYIVGTSMTVGQLQQSITQEEVISKDSAIYSQKLIDAVKSIVTDVKDIQSLSLKTLYEHYGISVLNGISGIDFTDKDFYSVPIKDLIADSSTIVNSFTLNDISKVAGVDFSSYGLPILNDNLNNNVKTAIDDIMSSLNGDLTIRSIKDKFGIDIGTGDNALISAVQDLSLSAFGSVVNAITLDKLITVDTDTFVKSGANDVFVKADRYEIVSDADLADSSYKAPDGVETYIAGAIDSNSDGTADSLVQKELRYVKKTTTAEDGSESVTYVVDNSCYSAEFSVENNQKTFYRHVLYEKYAGASGEYFVKCYANKVISFSGATYLLHSKGFLSLDTIFCLSGGDYAPLSETVSSGSIEIDSCFRSDGKGGFESAESYFVLDDPITNDSRLRTLEDGESAGERTPYLRAHVGTSEQVLQLVAHMSVNELQNADDLLKSLTVGDVVSDDSSKLINALKDCKLSEIGSKINTLKVEDVLDVDDSSSPVLKALAKRGATLDTINTVINEMSVGELMDITFDAYTAQADGDYVKVDLFVPYNAYIDLHVSAKEANGLFVKDAGGNYIPTSDESGDVYVNIGRYTLFDSVEHAGLERYALTTESSTSIALQSMARHGYSLQTIGAGVDNLKIDELVRVRTDSTKIMRALAKRGTSLGGFADVVDTLKLSEIIDVTAESAKIMKSLVARDCLVKDIDKIANELTLSETVDITFDDYTADPSGKYVKVVNDTSYVFYDEENPLMNGMQRFAKDSSTTPASYVADENGEYVNAFYFTLFNVAKHSDASVYARYSRIEAVGSSSRVLQRIAFSNVGDFSAAFDSLALGDVIDIDPDVLAVADSDFKAANPDVTYYSYDETYNVYKRNEAGAYYVAVAGTSTAVLRRLAFVPVNDLSSAMEIVMKDMLLAELIDVYENYAVALDSTFDPATAPSSETLETDRFIISPVGSDEGGEYTYVFNLYGKYIQRDYKFVAVDKGTLSQTGTTTYEYTKINTASEALAAAASFNLYYKNGEEYVYNFALCVYLVSVSKFDNLYTRTSSASGITAPVYGDADLYVEQNGVYTPYSSTNLTHLDCESYFVKQTTPCFVPTTTPAASDDLSYAYLGKDEDGNSLEPLFSKEYCEKIYVLSATGAKVYNGSEYVDYDEAQHAGLERFDEIVGYLATANETYVKSGGVYSRGLDNIYTRVERENGMIREKSQAVIRMLATRKVTIQNIDSVIKDATIGEIMDVTPDSIFDKFKDSTINNLNTNLQSTITEMTVAELMEFSGTTTTNATVRSALKDVKLKNFFNSLTFNPTVGIVVDMEKACGYSA